MSIRRTMVFTIQRLRHGACHGLIQGRCCVAFFRKNHHSKFRKSQILVARDLIEAYCVRDIGLGRLHQN